MEIRNYGEDFRSNFFSFLFFLNSTVNGKLAPTHPNLVRSIISFSTNRQPVWQHSSAICENILSSKLQTETQINLLIWTYLPIWENGDGWKKKKICRNTTQNKMLIQRFRRCNYIRRLFCWTQLTETKRAESQSPLKTPTSLFAVG